MKRTVALLLATFVGFAATAGEKSGSLSTAATTKACSYTISLPVGVPLMAPAVGRNWINEEANRLNFELQDAVIQGLRTKGYGPASSSDEADLRLVFGIWRGSGMPLLGGSSFPSECPPGARDAYNTPCNYNSAYYSLTDAHSYPTAVIRLYDVNTQDQLYAKGESSRVFCPTGKETGCLFRAIRKALRDVKPCVYR